MIAQKFGIIKSRLLVGFLNYFHCPRSTQELKPWSLLLFEPVAGVLLLPVSVLLPPVEGVLLLPVSVLPPVEGVLLLPVSVLLPPVEGVLLLPVLVLLPPVEGVLLLVPVPVLVLPVLLPSTSTPTPPIRLSSSSLVIESVELASSEDVVFSLDEPVLLSTEDVLSVPLLPLLSALPLHPAKTEITSIATIIIANAFFKTSHSLS